MKSWYCVRFYHKYLQNSHPIFSFLFEPHNTNKNEIMDLGWSIVSFRDLIETGGPKIRLWR